MLDSDAPMEKVMGGQLAGVTALYQGNYRSLIEGIDELVATLEVPGQGPSPGRVHRLSDAPSSPARP